MKASLDSCHKLQYLAVHSILQTFGFNHFRNWKWLNPNVCKKRQLSKNLAENITIYPEEVSLLSLTLQKADVAHTFGKVNNKGFLVIGEIHFVRLWEVGTLYFQWTTKWRRILQSVKHANSPTVDEERSSCLCSRRATIHRARSNLRNKNNNTTQLHVPIQMVYHTQSSVWLGLQMQLDYFIFIFFLTARGRQR